MSLAARLLASALILTLASFPSAALTEPLSAAHGAASLYTLTLPDGSTAKFYRGGIAEITSKDHRSIEHRLLRTTLYYDGNAGGAQFPDKSHVSQMLALGTKRPFVSGRVLVAYRDNVQATSDVFTAKPDPTRKAATPAYTNDIGTNRTLAALGVARSERLFRRFNRSVLASMRSSSPNATAQIDLANVYRLEITGASVNKAVAALSKLPSVAYVSPDWNVQTMAAPAVPIRTNALEASRVQAQSAWRAQDELQPRAAALPTNYALTSSAQSLLNAPGTGAAAAYAEISQHFGQLPGAGETITNVSLGDLDDASAAANYTDPCYRYAAGYGPTTIVQGSQRYLSLPSMPLIPTYTTTASGELDGQGEVCGLDPSLAEVGLDFSMMSPLPHNLQRPGAQGSGYTDLLGVAPGANYRLVVPGTGTAISDVDTALLAAASQRPQPDVITASIGYGFDSYGFPDRYLEEDPLSEAVVHTIVSQYGIVVCLSSGDGTRTSTPVSIGPSGGSVATTIAQSPAQTSSVNDDAFTTIPSSVLDSGSLDVGGTTLDDIFSVPPQYATSSTAQAQHAYAETRWTGATSLSSGFGSRVNVSAPADNVLSFQHTLGGSPEAVDVVLEGGTSASAPEVAAAAAIALQVARLTGHPLTTVQAVRTLLEQTASAVPNVAQADTQLNVGPQVDVRALVERLLAQGNVHGMPAVARVAVEQRRNYADLDAAFLTDTNAANIQVGADPLTALPDQLAWITIAPDWQYLPASSTYRLFVSGHSQPLATTPWARLLPETILQAAGLPLVSSSKQTVKLVYQAKTGTRIAAKTTISLTFGPSSSGPISTALAPNVPPVVTGTTLLVSYDVSNVANLSSPKIVVSEPGRINPATGQVFHPAYTVALPSQAKGTVKIPVSALQGGGIYGVGIQLGTQSVQEPSGSQVVPLYSDFAYTRVASLHPDRPQAPVLSAGGVSGHELEIPYGSSFSVHYDVSKIAGATGAMLEISAAGPGGYAIYNPFNNPNGSIEDDNGLDLGSVYYVQLPGTSGTATFNSAKVGLDPALYHDVRIVPMQYGKAAGEASDVSSISMDGVLPPDGSVIALGWGINPNGSDGFFTGNQEINGATSSTIEGFSQATNQVTKLISSDYGNSVYQFFGWGGPYANDLGLFGSLNETTGNVSFYSLSSVSNGTFGGAWTPPAFAPNSEFALNTANDMAVYFIQAGAGWNLYSSNTAANTFSPAYNLLSPISSYGLPNIVGIALNPTTNVAVLPAVDLFNLNNPPAMLTVDLTHGTVSSFSGKGSGYAYGISIDPNTNTAAVPTEDGGFTIYNLAAQTGNEFFLPQPPPGEGPYFGQYTAVDMQRREFLVMQVTAPNYAVDNNNLSSVLVYNESGTLLKTIERFDLWSTVLLISVNNLQVNSNTDTGYMIGPQSQELTPFPY